MSVLIIYLTSVSSVTQLCLNPCDPMDYSMPGFTVHHQLPELARLHCSSPTPRACPHSCPLGWLCHQTISSFVFPFSSHLQSFPASRSFPMSQFFPPGGQIIGVSTSASVLAMNTQDWSPLGWTGWISLQSKGLLRVFSNTTV